MYNPFKGCEKMSKKIKHEINRVCAFCELAERMNNQEKMLCSRKGVVASDYCCKKFIYDPLKREPAAPVKLPEVDPADLVL